MSLITEQLKNQLKETYDLAMSSPKDSLDIKVLYIYLNNAFSLMSSLEARISRLEDSTHKLSNDASCIANGIIPD